MRKTDLIDSTEEKPCCTCLIIKSHKINLIENIHVLDFQSVQSQCSAHWKQIHFNVVK